MCDNVMSNSRLMCDNAMLSRLMCDNAMSNSRLMCDNAMSNTVG